MPFDNNKKDIFKLNVLKLEEANKERKKQTNKQTSKQTNGEEINEKQAAISLNGNMHLYSRTNMKLYSHVTKPRLIGIIRQPEDCSASETNYSEE